MNTDVMIIKDAAINQKTISQQLDFQELSIYGVDAATSEVKLATNSLAVSSAYFAVGTRNGNTDISNDIRKGATVYQLKKFPYVASVLASKKVTVSAFGASNFDEFLLKVNSRGLSGQSGIEDNIVTYSISGIYADLNAWATAMKAKIEQSAIQDITASVSTGLVLTAKYPGQSIDVSLEHVPYSGSSNYTISVTTVASPLKGSGSAAEISALYKKFKSAKGGIYDSDRAIPQAVDDLSVSGNYITYFAEWSNPTQPKGEQGKVFDVRNKLFLCAPSGMTVTTLEGVLAQVFGQAIQTVSSANTTTTTTP